MASYTYPSKLTNQDLHPAWMQFQFFERKSPKDSRPDDVIRLYMPEGVSQPNTVSWDTEKFGIVGSSITNFMNGEGSNTAMLGDVGAVGIARAKANIAAAAASRLGGSVSAEGIMGATQGRIPNPYLTMVFRGVDFRNYAFQFKFFPFNEAESKTIHDIIKAFRANSLPPGQANSPFLQYPKEVEIAYKWKADDNPFLQKFKRSVITAVDVDYTSTGMFAVMRNGAPAAITMNIKLSEIELVLRDDVENEGY